MPILSDWQIQVTADQVLRAQGAEPESLRQRRPQLAEIAAWAALEGAGLIEPRVLYQSFQVKALRHERVYIIERDGDVKYLRPPLFLSGPLVAGHFGQAQQVVAILCTLGERLESIAGELMATDPLQGWALDGYGSAAVEQLAALACAHFESQAEAGGLHASLPLSPGMEGWPAAQGQPELLGLLEPGLVGVRLLESGMMRPLKTLSLAIGLGTEMSHAGHPCDYCSLNQTCRYQADATQ